MIITRRMLLTAASATVFVRPGFSAKEFWNDKKPADWTDEEVQQLLTNSPWAKEATVSMDMEGMGRRSGGMGGPGGMGGGGVGGGGGMGGRGGMGGQGGIGGQGGEYPGGGMGGPGGGFPGGGRDMGGPPPVKVLVRWDSALPVREATRKRAETDAYLISVIGLPMMRGRARPGDERGEDSEDRRKAMAERLRASTRLERKGKDPLNAASVEFIDAAQGGAMQFHFPHDDHPITTDDKQVTFVTKMGPMDLKVKFPLKQMMYRGGLAL